MAVNEKILHKTGSSTGRGAYAKGYSDGKGFRSTQGRLRRRTYVPVPIVIKLAI